MMSNLWQSESYLAPINIIIGVPIYEYDLSKANISILLKAGVIGRELYDRLYSADKHFREVYVGNMQRESSTISDVLKEGFTEARRLLFAENQIRDDEVISIKKDAVFVVGRRLASLVFGELVFREASAYTSFLNLKNIELYYFYDRGSEFEVLDIKGLGKAAKEKHANFMIDYLAALMQSLQVDSIEDAISMHKGLYDSYVNLQLNVEFYRRFDPISRFDIQELSMCSSFQCDFIPSDFGLKLDISYNENILRKINSILYEVFFSSKR